MIKEKIENNILKIYSLLPAFLKDNPKVSAYVGEIAERKLRQVKQDVLQANWKKVQLEKQLKDLKQSQ